MTQYGPLANKGYAYSKAQSDALFAAQRPTSEASYLASGGGVANVSGLTFRVSAGQAFIRGALYSFPQVDLTLGAANVANPRIDIIVADSATLTYHVIAGVAAANPELPNIDPLTQVQVTLILVPTGAVTIPTITQTALYREATETTVTVANARIVAASTNNPLAGTKDIEATAAVADDWVKLTNAGSITISAANQLILNIRSKAAWVNQKNIQLQWLNGSAKVGQVVSVADKLFGFVSSQITAYQQIVVPIANFQLSAGATATALEIRVKGSGAAIGFYLDEIFLESSGVISTPAPVGKATTVASGTVRTSTDSADPQVDLSTVVDSKIAAALAIQSEVLVIAVTDEATAITAGTAKVTFRMPFAMTLTALPRASLNTVSSAGNPAIDINEGGASIFSTTLTIDSGEKTSVTAATPAVLSDSALADDAEITIDIDTAGTGAKGLKVVLIGRRT
jgi:hypothetical protein